MELKKMADILLKGGKMLNKSCPDCNAPLFKYQARTFCASCGWEEGKPPQAEAAEVTPIKPSVPAGERVSTAPAFNEISSVLADAKKVVLDRISQCSRKLADEGEGCDLEANMRTLSDLLDLLEKIIGIETRRG